MFRKSALISLSALLLAMPGQTETLQQALDQAFQTNPALAAQRAVPYRSENASDLRPEGELGLSRPGTA